MRLLVTLLLALSVLNATAIANGTDEDIPLEVLRTQKYAPFSSKPIIRKSTSPAYTQVEHSQSSATIPKVKYGFTSGSLKDNITHLAKQFGWRTVVWQPVYDYQWVGTARFTERNIKHILAHVLQNFPLQAVFYEGNHVLVIAPRNLS
ncbi:MAG: hypothetical protein A3F17_03385 [Gammaproteobacteria bacterium RIFCSPHIGHO2_12_FULL_41_15]|nr:MAG: hypothetical protein A3F17_03385 [Gammaproteobacteria bacterium RIFCSPHIGHO2_12_FULL_41_15]